MNKKFFFNISFIVLFFVILNSWVSAQSDSQIKSAKSMQEAGISSKPVNILHTELTDYLNEGFETAVMPPTGWSQIIGNPAFSWEIEDFAPYAGLYYTDVEYDPALVPQDEWIVSPSLDLSAVTGTLYLKFHWSASYAWFVDPNDNGEVYMKISSDGGTVWTPLWSETDAGVFTDWVWYETELDISSYIGQSNVQIAMNYTGTDAAQFNLDEISIYNLAGPGVATDPTPVDAATDISINDLQLSWTNPGTTTTNEVLFGADAGNLVSIHTGSLVTSVNAPSPLSYSTTYYWRVDETDVTGTTTGSVWSFTTEQNPDLVVDQVFFDDFEVGDGWTVTNDGGTCVWEVLIPPVSRYTLPETSTGNIAVADVDACGSGSTILSTATINSTFDLSLYTSVFIEFDNDFRIADVDDEAQVEVSTDGGANWVSVWGYIGEAVRNSHEVINASTELAGQSSVNVRVRTVQPGWDWWWAIDNFAIYGEYIIPVELTSFTASTVGGKVNLSWTTATETNNYGFEVERKATGQEYAKVGFISGYGTTTEIKSYSFVDNTVTSGSYTYRLKQVDLDGSFEYSNEVNADLTPAEYSLSQNYPNPFNPTTRIDFTLSSDSKVTLKIFDVLGQEVLMLINGNLGAGVHTRNFNASNLNSGIYFYQIEAQGIDGSNFSQVRKMMLTK